MYLLDCMFWKSTNVLELLVICCVYILLYLHLKGIISNLARATEQMYNLTSKESSSFVLNAIIIKHKEHFSSPRGKRDSCVCNKKIVIFFFWRPTSRDMFLQFKIFLLMSSVSHSAAKFMKKYIFFCCLKIIPAHTNILR